ncbi:hypothetical protein [Rhizobium sp. BK176]|uniref:hypothetical protein n=1 Tax=Rhizobium sp. BK176 TaxID=2587071 RepID=UPI0021696AC7|nr:hypothetical protein [Rhizobium sp. BK176]MCS4089171.1 hypothetical protein [Rhizobium sp. BK176]
MSGIRPRSLAEVVDVGGAEYALPLDEFLDEFYTEYPDRDAMQAMISASPAYLGNEFADSYIGAVGEHLALRWDLEVPDWTCDARRSGGRTPRFVPDMPSLRPILLVEAPYAFRRRNIFTGEEPLQRARWPREVAVYEPAGLSRSPR